MKERNAEATHDGDHKKQFHSITIEAHENQAFAHRQKIREIEKQLQIIEQTISPSDLKLLKQHSVLSNPQFWDRGEFSETEKAQYYRDVFQIDPRIVVKFLEYVTLTIKLNQYKKDM